MIQNLFVNEVALISGGSGNDLCLVVTDSGDCMAFTTKTGADCNELARDYKTSTRFYLWSGSSMYSYSAVKNGSGKNITHLRDCLDKQGITDIRIW